jgi:hypothetical protein
MSLTTEPSTDITAKLDKVRTGFVTGVLRSLADRETQLRQLRRFLVEEETTLCEALAADLGKPPIEAYTTEIGFTINEVGHALDHLHRWSSPRKVGVPIHQRPGSGRIVHEPLGTVLIIAPWNYPLQLLLAPLVPALAAGNTAILKPSEVAPATAAVVEERLPKFLDNRVVQVVNGGVAETTELLGQRFDHIFYTGNGTVGRIVMKAAAEHLTPVTLELGGEEPDHRHRFGRHRSRRPPHRVGQVHQRRADVCGTRLRARRRVDRRPVRRGARNGDHRVLWRRQRGVARLWAHRVRTPLRPPVRSARCRWLRASGPPRRHA